MTDERKFALEMKELIIEYANNLQEVERLDQTIECQARNVAELKERRAELKSKVDRLDNLKAFLVPNDRKLLEYRLRHPNQGQDEVIKRLGMTPQAYDRQWRGILHLLVDAMMMESMRTESGADE